MFSKPLNEDARNLKIEIQKEIIYYLKKEGSEKAKKEGNKNIEIKHLQPIINNLSSYKKIIQEVLTLHLKLKISRFRNLIMISIHRFHMFIALYFL